MEYPLLAARMFSHGKYCSAFREKGRADTPKPKSIEGLSCSFVSLKRAPDLEEKADIVSHQANQTVDFSFITPGGKQVHGGMNTVAGIVFKTSI